MIAFIAFVWVAIAIVLALYLGPRLKAVSERYPLFNAEEKPESPVKYASKDSPIYVVSNTFAEADHWRREHGWHRDNTYWVSGPAGLRTAIPQSTVVFTGDWEARSDAPELWAQAHEGFNILVEGSPEPVAEEMTISELDELRAT